MSSYRNYLYDLECFLEKEIIEFFSGDLSLKKKIHYVFLGLVAVGPMKYVPINVIINRNLLRTGNTYTCWIYVFFRVLYERLLLCKLGFRATCVR